MANRLYFLFVVMMFSMGLAGCGGGGQGNGTGTLQLGITDAPVDSAEAVVIHFTAINLHHDGGTRKISVIDPVTKLEGYSIDLLALQAGQWTGLVDAIITAGHYSWIRLDVDLSKSYIQIGGQMYDLVCNSCENNGYKLNSSFTVEQDAVLALMLDFDLRKSITDPANGSNAYILRPTLRTIEMAASGRVSGSVDPTLIANLGGIEGCAVYVFDGHDAIPNDVYIPFDMMSPVQQHNNPVSTTNVFLDNDSSYTYTLAFLPAGNYTASLTCDAEQDNAATIDNLLFVNSANINVVAGETTTLNFTMPIAVPLPE